MHQWQQQDSSPKSGAVLRDVRRVQIIFRGPTKEHDESSGDVLKCPCVDTMRLSEPTKPFLKRGRIMIAASDPPAHLRAAIEHIELGT